MNFKIIVLNGRSQTQKIPYIHMNIFIFRKGKRIGIEIRSVVARIGGK